MKKERRKKIRGNKNAPLQVQGGVPILGSGIKYIGRMDI